MPADAFPGRLAIQQRVLTPYRAAFFDRLAGRCRGGLGVFAGLPRADESIGTADRLEAARLQPARNLHLLRGPFYLCLQPGLTSWLEQWNPDVLILEANPRYLSSGAAIGWMEYQSRPVIGWGLGAPAASGVLSGLRKARRLSFLKRFDALVSYSRRGAEEYAGLGFPADMIFVAPNAAAGRPAWPVPSRPAGFSGRPGLLFVGRLQARKRLDLLLQACAALPPDLQPHLVIVGDGPELATLRDLAGRLQVRVEFTGALHGPELAERFRQADLFVLPGTGGLAVQEAMSHGLPVVMGEGDGTNTDLVGPANGWQVRPGDLGDLSSRLQEALEDPARLRAMGAESFRIVCEQVNLETMVEVFLQAACQVTGMVCR